MGSIDHQSDGTQLTKGRRRVPKPPTRMSAADWSVMKGGAS